MYQITLCNEFIRQSADDQLAARNITGSDADQIREFETGRWSAKKRTRAQIERINREVVSANGPPYAMCFARN